MYEIPEILMFVCGLLLMGILATVSTRLRVLFGTMFIVCSAVTTVVLFDVQRLLYTLPVAGCVLLLVVLISDAFVEKYSIKTTITRLHDDEELR